MKLGDIRFETLTNIDRRRCFLAFAKRFLLHPKSF